MLAEAEGFATPEQRAVLEADEAGWRRVLERLADRTAAQLEAAERLRGPERFQVVADFETTLDLLEDAIDRLAGPAGTAGNGLAGDPPGEVRLQASWSSDRIVVWAAGPRAAPADNDGLSDHLEAMGAPGHGWDVHAPVRLPGGARAAALSIRLADALGWLVAVAAGTGGERVGQSLTWLSRLALAGVAHAARGAVVPALRSTRRDGTAREVAVRWSPALLDPAQVGAFTASMPPAVVAVTPAKPRTVVDAVLAATVQAIVAEAAGRMELPAPPPFTNTPAAVAEAFVTRLDGSGFQAPARAAAEISTRLDRWTKPVTSPTRPVLTVQLDAPDTGDAWLLSVLAPGGGGRLVPVERAMADAKAPGPIGDELARLERLFPRLVRAGSDRRGQVYLDQAEAWQLMTSTGRSLEAAGFSVRVPSLSRRKPTPALRLFTMTEGDTVVGARQLAAVRWSVVFDDVELTAGDIARLSKEATPLVKSRGRWVELDRADLDEAAAALAERAATTHLTGADVLRHAIGLEATGLGGGIRVEGTGWAADLLEKAAAAKSEPVSTPEGFNGELRTYQAEAIGWLAFLDAVGLGGCLALDMGLGKTPTVLAHIARTAGHGPALVVAPPAVVGNWAAEARRFAPGLRAAVHHGASRASASRLADDVARADLVITTYGTAVRDVEALAAIEWDRVVLDEAQAVKNPASETAQQLRLIPARNRLALTGTPVENGLGDLWAILDYTNPGLLGARAAFVAQMSGEGQDALRALNGILVFRRTKSEPVVAAELPDRIDELDHCAMTPEQIGLYQAVLDRLVTGTGDDGQPASAKQGAILAAITALKQICNHPAAYVDDGRPLAGRSGKLARLQEIVDAVFEAEERILVFTHFAEWGKRLATHLTETTGVAIECYHGGLARRARDELVREFQEGKGAGALVLSLKAGGTGLNLTAASHVVLYDRWWNPAVEDQARDRAWRIGQTRTVVSHRLVCPGTVDERVEEVVEGKRHVADLVLPKSSSLADLDADQLRFALGLRPDTLLTEDAS